MVRTFCSKTPQNAAFRDSLLTHFLHPQISGNNAFIALIACVSLSEVQEFETIRTLDFSNDLSNKKQQVVRKQVAPKRFDVIKLELEN